MWAVYTSSLIIGLSASLHCLGMCGPLVMAIPMKTNNVYERSLGMLQYHIGKTFTYALLGLLAGLIGISIQTFKWMQLFSVISGVAIVFFAWAKFVRFPFGNKFRQLFIRFSGTTIRKLFQSGMPFKPLLFGIINGLLPCGLIYIALINSLLAGSPFSGMMAMVFFGLGTVPVLTLARWISGKFQWRTNRWTPVLITLVGLMVVFRGLNLGIPYLSPKIEVQQATNGTKEETEEVVMNCCHKEKSCEQP